MVTMVAVTIVGSPSRANLGPKSQVARGSGEVPGGCAVVLGAGASGLRGGRTSLPGCRLLSCPLSNRNIVLARTKFPRLPSLLVKTNLSRRVSVPMN
jgi:hypothetical protein